MYSQEVTHRPRQAAEPSEEWKLVLQAGFQPGPRGQQEMSWEQETGNSISNSWRGERIHKKVVPHVHLGYLRRIYCPLPWLFLGLGESPSTELGIHSLYHSFILSLIHCLLGAHCVVNTMGNQQGWLPRVPPVVKIQRSNCLQCSTVVSTQGSTGCLSRNTGVVPTQFLLLILTGKPELTKFRREVQECEGKEKNAEYSILFRAVAEV